MISRIKTDGVRDMALQCAYDYVSGAPASSVDVLIVDLEGGQGEDSDRDRAAAAAVCAPPEPVMSPRFMREVNGHRSNRSFSRSQEYEFLSVRAGGCHMLP